MTEEGLSDISALSHPLRASLSEEMHARTVPHFSAPCRLMQVLTLTDGAQSIAHMSTLARKHGGPESPGKFAILPLEDMTLVWELHSEFASYTLIRPGPSPTLFDPSDFGGLVDDLLEDLPGKVVRATQIAVLSRYAPPPTKEQLEAAFTVESLVVCDVAGGTARIWSDFRLKPDGYGRLLVADRGLEGGETTRLVQKVQELGNYRNMALLGLPPAQRLTPEVSRLEARLAKLSHDVSEGSEEDHVLLEELSFLSAELARLDAETRYRMSATRAYAQLSADRLAAIEASKVRGYPTLADFTERRLMPAIRTCQSFSQRLDDLSQRAAWTSSLLRTRVDTALARQNRDLLHSMDRRTQAQLRLQQAVEGLSVAAISYYLVGLSAYVIKAVPGIPHEAAIAVLVPVVITIASLSLLLLRRRLHD
ncbi:DUF3422 domain-containing protein [Aquisediminimonas profunda]|uniref:DUF3422 domain-containing protein n=1 Tax=Aquisediminimonas profunda TaxID=1550733 RepID=UPI001C62C930|nr:DUF3422 domain-containing protein [Aquisediminimonas profunda]